MINTSTLTNLGLTDNEAKIYLSFLYEGETTAADISRKMKLDKSSTYRAVESLTKKQLLIVTPRTKGTTYSPVNPSSLRNIINQKRQELSSQSSALDNFIEKIQNDVLKDNLPSTYFTVKKGYQALIDMHELKLKIASESKDKLIRERWHSDHYILKSKKYTDYIEKYAERRINLDIKINAMHTLRKNHDPYPHLLKSSKKYKKEVRLWPDEIIDKNTFAIFGDYVTFFNTGSDEDNENDLLIISIKEPFLVEIITNLYDFVWRRAEIIK